MKQLYTEQPNLGNLSQVEEEMQKCKAEYVELENELQKYQVVSEILNNCQNLNLFPVFRHFLKKPSR